MNNKYDVTNFSKLIEEYDNEKEVKTILSHVQNQIKKSRLDINYVENQSIFDPIVEMNNKINSKYEFT
jgi:hypothetical protein